MGRFAPLEEELLLRVDPELGPVLPGGGEADVEGVAAHVPPVGEDVLPGHEDRVAQLEIVGEGSDLQVDRLLVGIQGQQVWSLGAQPVHERGCPEEVAAVRDPPVTEVGASLEIEGADSAMHDPVAARHPRPVADAAPPHLLLEPQVEPGLRGAAIREVPEVSLVVGREPSSPDDEARIHGVRHEGKRAHRPRRGIGRGIASRDAIGNALAQHARQGGAPGVGHPASLAELGARFTVEAGQAEPDRRPFGCAGRPGDDVHHPRERVGSPHRRCRAPHHLDLLDVGRVHRNHVPQDDADEVLVDRAAVDQDELEMAQGGRRLTTRHVEVTDRGPHRVLAGHGA